MRPRLIVLAATLATTAALAFTATAAAEAPQMRAPASISGTAAVGQELTAHNGTWLYDNGMSCQSECTMSYQWQRCADDGSCTDIGGAGTRFYTVQSADAGSRIRVMETMSIYDCGAGDSQTGIVPCRWDRRSAPSAMTSVVPGGSPSAPAAPAAPTVPAAPAPQAPLAPTATAAPTVSGVAMVDETLSATLGAWTGAPALTLEWLRCDEAGHNCVGLGITQPSYRVLAVDVGKTLRVKVTGRNVVGARDALSEQTAIVSELKPTEQKPSLEASKVLAPHRLVVTGLAARPAKLSRRGTLTVRLTVADTRGFLISGALVSAVVRPVGAFALPEGATSSADGAVTLTFKPGPRLKLRKVRSVTLIVTARRPGDRLTSPRAGIQRLTLRVAAAEKRTRR